MVFMSMPLLRNFTSLQHLFSRTSVGNMFVKCKSQCSAVSIFSNGALVGEKRQSDEKMIKEKCRKPKLIFSLFPSTQRSIWSGECKFKNKPFRYSEYLDTIAKLSPQKEKSEFYYYLFSESGFDDKILEEATNADNITLCNLSDIVEKRKSEI